MMQTFYQPKTLMTWDVRAPGLMAVQSIVSAFLICTTPKGSLLRLGALPVLLYLSYVCIRTSSAFSLQVILYLGFAVCSYINVFQCFNFLWLHPIDDRYIRHEMTKWKSSSANPGLVERVYFTTALLWSFRGVGTSHEIKTMPRFPGNVVPTKRVFLLRQAAWIAFMYLFIDLVTSQPQGPEVAEARALGKEWLWLPLNPHPVTRADITRRMMNTLFNWYLVGRMLLDIWYCVFSVVFVGLGISEPKQWPPMYGSYSQCYTIRRYFKCVYP